PPSAGAARSVPTRCARQLDAPPATIEPNQPLTFSLFVRAAGDTVLAHIDAPSTSVIVSPDVPVRTEVSGDRKFLTIVPLAPWGPAAGGSVSVAIAGQYLVHPMRTGLRFSGGAPAGSFSQPFSFHVRPVATH